MSASKGIPGAYAFLDHVDNSWKLKGRCHGSDDPRWLQPELIDHYYREMEAKSMCSGCPVIDQCREDALARGDVGVIRGGFALSPSDNKFSALRARQREELARLVEEAHERNRS